MRSLDCYHFYSLMTLKETLTFLPLSNQVLQYKESRSQSKILLEDIPRQRSSRAAWWPLEGRYCLVIQPRYPRVRILRHLYPQSSPLHKFRCLVKEEVNSRWAQGSGWGEKQAGQVYMVSCEVGYTFGSLKPAVSYPKTHVSYICHIYVILGTFSPPQKRIIGSLKAHYTFGYAYQVFDW